MAKLKFKDENNNFIPVVQDGEIVIIYQTQYSIQMNLGYYG